MIDLLQHLRGVRPAGTHRWVALCPAHRDRRPSLSIRLTERGWLLHDFAGCSFLDVVAAIGIEPRDLFADAGSQWVTLDRDPEPDDARRTEAALRIWRSCWALAGSRAETYLRAARDITLPLPNALRYHPALRHPSGGTWPALVALVRNGVTGAPVAIHRTYLYRDGSDKADIEPPRLALGPCRGGAVRLADPTDVLAIGEGIETVLSWMELNDGPGWAALSTSGMRALELPADLRNVIIVADGDEPGELAAQACAARWRRKGRRVRIDRPPMGFDFNDVLTEAARARG